MILLPVISMLISTTAPFIPGLLENRIIDDNLICISDKQSESRSIGLVKTAYDYGEFYFLSFPMGKKSGNFVCQKDLLTQGTLEEFEKLFDGKIVRKY